MDVDKCLIRRRSVALSPQKMTSKVTHAKSEDRTMENILVGYLLPSSPDMEEYVDVVCDSIQSWNNWGNQLKELVFGKEEEVLLSSIATILPKAISLLEVFDQFRGLIFFVGTREIPAAFYISTLLSTRDELQLIC